MPEKKLVNKADNDVFEHTFEWFTKMHLNPAAVSYRQDNIICADFAAQHMLGERFVRLKIMQHVAKTVHTLIMLGIKYSSLPQLQSTS